ncbi:MAG TPA: SH3 domain-containing protein [Candidatus Binataceae bacterium]
MRRSIVLVLIVLLLIAPFTVLAQTSEPQPPAPPPEGAPAEVAPPPEAAPAPAPVHHRKRIRKRRRHHAKAPEVETTVEPANARLKVQSSGAPIYARGSRRSEQIGTLSADKYVQVTGSTKSYLQIQLKDGRVGYIEPSAVDLVKPYDKQFLLTADSPVFTAPNQFAQKVGEVHRGKYIHVIGQALSYVQIRMKDGTQGFVPMTAAQ